MRNIFPLVLFLLLFFLLGCGEKNPLKDKIICIDPGHGGTAAVDSFRVGPNGEREEWIDLRVALHLRDMLVSKSAKVFMTRTKDVDIPLIDRAFLAVNNKADIFVSIHHNATADSSVNFPIIYFHGNASENQASVVLGRLIANHLKKKLFNRNTSISLVSDHTIFPEAGTAVLRHSYGIPGIIGEASFFSNPEEEKRLKEDDYNKKEAEAYCQALEDYFKIDNKSVLEKYSTIKVTPFPVFQEAERMNEIAKKWQEDFGNGKRLFTEGSLDSLNLAYELFSRSVKSFPDSYLARESHLYRIKILEKISKKDEAQMEKKRVQEFYVDLIH